MSAESGWQPNPQQPGASSAHWPGAEHAWSSSSSGFDLQAVSRGRVDLRGARERRAAEAFLADAREQLLDGIGRRRHDASVLRRDADVLPEVLDALRRRRGRDRREEVRLEERALRG